MVAPSSTGRKQTCTYGVEPMNALNWASPSIGLLSVVAADTGWTATSEAKAETAGGSAFGSVAAMFRTGGCCTWCPAPAADAPAEAGPCAALGCAAGCSEHVLPVSAGAPPLRPKAAVPAAIMLPSQVLLFLAAELWSGPCCAASNASAADGTAELCVRAEGGWPGAALATVGPAAVEACAVAGCG